MDVESMLASDRPSLLIIERRLRQDVVVGVPHHAPAGTSELPCPTHKASDENAGFIGRHLAERLDCCSVIASNYSIDVNKCLSTDYATQIAAWRPKILIEIHGHGQTRSSYDVEISCGSSQLTDTSENFAAALRQELVGDGALNDVTINGCFASLCFPATRSQTIVNSRWLSYHIELAPRLRKPESAPTGKPSCRAYMFCDYLATVVREKHG